MKATFKLPKTSKGWFSLSLILFVMLIGGWPVIPLLNHNTIVLGMPLLMIWSILIIILTTIFMSVINKIEGV